METIIFDYTVSLRVFELQSRLLDLVFAINGSVSCINTLLLGFCLTPHDSPDYGLICFEYILESLENLLDGRGILFGLENQNIENYLDFRESNIYPEYWNLLYFESIHTLKSVISPLQNVLRRVYYVIKDKDLNPILTFKIRMKLSSMFGLNKFGLCKYFNCRVFEENTNTRITELLLLHDVANQP